MMYIANCEPLGNLLIIQNENKTVDNPNDSAFGGCLVFTFIDPVDLINIGLLDVEEIANITVRQTYQGHTGLFCVLSNMLLFCVLMPFCRLRLAIVYRLRSQVPPVWATMVTG
jgi:hypothetical protein